MKQNDFGGYRNLLTRINGNHKESKMNRLQTMQTVNNTFFVHHSFTEMSKNVHAWIEHASFAICSFFFWKSVVITRNFKYSSISQNTLANDMHEFCKLVEVWVLNALSKKCATISHECSADFSYCMSVFATYVEQLSNNKTHIENEKWVTSKIVLSASPDCSTMGTEQFQSAEETQ